MSAELIPSSYNLAAGRHIGLINEHATRYSLARTFLDDIRDRLDIQIQEIPTFPHRDDTICMLADTLREGDTLYVFGGDHTVDTAVEEQADKSVPQVTIVPMHTGNAGNTYRGVTANGIERPSDLLTKGRDATIYPLRVSIIGEQYYSRSTASVVAVGGSGTGAVELEKPEHRNHPWRTSDNPKKVLAYEYWLATKSLFKIRTLNLEEGEYGTAAAELVAAATHIVAKEAHFDTNIEEHDFVFGMIKNARPWNLLRGLAGLKNGTLPVEHIRNNEKTIRFKLGEQPRNRTIFGQIGGDPIILHPGDIVEIDQPGYDDPTHRPVKVRAA